MGHRPGREPQWPAWVKGEVSCCSLISGRDCEVAGRAGPAGGGIASAGQTQARMHRPRSLWAWWAAPQPVS